MKTLITIGLLALASLTSCSATPAREAKPETFPQEAILEAILEVDAARRKALEADKEALEALEATRKAKDARTEWDNLQAWEATAEAWEAEREARVAAWEALDAMLKILEATRH